MKILSLLGSARKNGNTEQLINYILDGIEHTSIQIADHHIEPIIDMRHTEEGFSITNDDCDEIIQQLLDHDVILFATPLYWYGMSGQMKLFIDRWSQYLRDERFNFKEELSKKKAYVVITGGANAKFTGLPLVQQFGHIFDFVGMTFEDYLIGIGGNPGDIMNDVATLEKANHWKKLFQNK